MLNLMSVKESGRFQFILVMGLLLILLVFSILGIPQVKLENFKDFGTVKAEKLILVTGMIFISFGGLTKVASIAEEVKDPKKSITAGMFGAYAVVSILYLLSIFVTLGALDKQTMGSTLTPLSTAAAVFLGRPGFIILSLSAMMAFITTANAGLMAASRSPLAMSRDKLLPPFIGRVSKKYQTPVLSILLTSTFMICCILFLEIEDLVKMASTMMLLLFIMVNFSVILMRQSKIVSYRPSFKSPLYPYLQIAGIITYIGLILQMGRLPLILTGAFFALSVLWYFIYVKSKDSQKSAFIHMLERLTNKEIVDDEARLESELLNILRERDQIKEDRFDTIISRSPILDMDKTVNREEFFHEVALIIARRWDIEVEKVEEKLQLREEQASTLIYPGVAVPHAIPHIVIEGSHSFDIVLVRNKYGIIWNEEGDVVYTAFCLVGTKDERNFHLKALMSIAQILQDPDFHPLWNKARTTEELRSVILLTNRRRQ
ncbi:MAG: amino acid permease [Spirochaetales bacterium]|nr:amino acid permease [Spirochaetales bacterium]